MTEQEREDLNTFKHDLVKKARWWQWKAETLEKENEHLKSENAAMRERIDKAVEVLEKLKEEIEPRVYKSFFGFVVQVRTLQEHKEIYGTEEDALARLAELKGGDHE